MVFGVLWLNAVIRNGGGLFDEWSLTAPGRMELVGTPYYFTTVDGSKFTTYGPDGYSDSCYVVSVCKRRINEHRASKKEMGL